MAENNSISLATVDWAAGQDIRISNAVLIPRDRVDIIGSPRNHGVSEFLWEGLLRPLIRRDIAAPKSTIHDKGL